MVIVRHTIHIIVRRTIQIIGRMRIDTEIHIINTIIIHHKITMETDQAVATIQVRVWT